MSHGVDRLVPFSVDECDFLRARGFTFAARYLKNLSGGEVASLLSRRLGIVPISEEGGAGPWTYLSGKTQAATDRARALAFGCPLGSPIIFAIDTDADPQTLVDYFNGVFDGLDGAYLGGVYGSYRVVKFARENFPALGCFWQTYAWSAGQVYAPADIYQHANGVTLRAGMSQVDLNTAISPIPWRLA